MSWLTNWEEAARHPVRAVLATFWLAFLPVAAYFYYTDRNLRFAALMGITGGGICAFLCLRAIRDPERARRVTFGRFGIEYLYGGLGLVLVVVGIAKGSATLALAGLPLAVLAVGWHLIKRSVSRRR